MGIIIAAIIIISIIIVIGVLSFLLNLFVTKALHDNIGLLARVIVGLLVLQFILGMLANLFAQVPTKEPYLVFHQFGYISAHTTNAAILIILAVIFRIKAQTEKDSRVASIIGALGIFIAFLSGIIFVNLGQDDIFSFTMALGFITAFLAYTYEAFAPIHI